MKPLRMDHTNLLLTGGEGVDVLPATVNGGIAYTYWEPTERDRDRIAAGGHVRLCVRGPHPAVMVDTEE